MVLLPAPHTKKAFILVFAGGKSQIGCDERPRLTLDHQLIDDLPISAFVLEPGPAGLIVRTKDGALKTLEVPVVLYPEQVLRNLLERIKDPTGPKNPIESGDELLSLPHFLGPFSARLIVL